MAVNSGELVTLRATDGVVVARERLRIDGHEVVPLSPPRVGQTGTLDGRVITAV